MDTNVIGERIRFSADAMVVITTDRFHIIQAKTKLHTPSRVTTILHSQIC